MLSWIFQAYADAFSVATFQPARRPGPAARIPDEDCPTWSQRVPVTPSWRPQPSLGYKTPDRREPLRRAA